MNGNDSEPEKVIFEQRLSELRVQAIQTFGERALQAVGTACVKAPRQV